MATEYPNSEFIGLDHVAFFPNDIRPANVTFIKHDALKGLPFEKESLDFVQIRLFALTFTRPNWDFTLKEAHRVLKPGGFIQIMEAQLLVRRKQKK
jgi:ubiquinone/menaquinone biosynthesis C-methylase UbiE